MPVPTPETALLNRFPETDRNLPPIPPLTADENDALEIFQFGLQKVLETLTQTSSASSTPSTSTLALEDDEIQLRIRQISYRTCQKTTFVQRLPRSMPPTEATQSPCPPQSDSGPLPRDLTCASTSNHEKRMIAARGVYNPSSCPG
jgi:hypothetical protein